MKLSDIEKIKSALSLYGTGVHGRCIQSCLFDLRFNIRISGEGSPKSATGIGRVQHDLNNAALLVSRIVTMKTLIDDPSLSRGVWRSYTQLDIESFIVQLRSLMDYSVTIIDGYALKKGQLPGSFQRLRNNLDALSSKLPPGVEDLVRDASWFDDMRGIRDAFVHGGAETMVFEGEPDEYLFQIHSEGRNLISHPWLMHNENVAYFDRYAAWQFGCVLSYLDALGSLFSKIDASKWGIGPVSNFCPGFEDLRIWMTELVDNPRGKAWATNLNVVGEV